MKKVLDLFPLLLAAGALFGAPAARADGLKDHAARLVRSATVVDTHEDLPEQLEMNRLGMLVDVSKIPILAEELLRRGHSEEEVRGVLGENFLAFWERAEGARKTVAPRQGPLPFTRP